MLEPSHRPPESQRRHASRRRPRPASGTSIVPSGRSLPEGTARKPSGAGETRPTRSAAAPMTGFASNQSSFDQATYPPVSRPTPSSSGELRRSRGTAPGHPGEPAPRRRRKPRPKRRPTPPLMQGIRLLILGVGIWAIAGTALSIWEPTVRSAQANQQDQANVAEVNSTSEAAPASNALSTAFKPGQEMTALAAQISPLTQGLTDLTPGVFLADLDSGNYYSLNGTTTFAAASMIKVPLLVAFFQDVDAGKIRLDEMMVMQQTDVATGSGDMQFLEVGSQFTALEVASNMIITSDNTATNMILRRLGGIAAVNQRFKSWGLEQTVIRNVLPDLEGTNTTSPKELAAIMSLLSQGELMSIKSRDRAIQIMQGTLTDTLLPTSLGQGATIAHKTGDIGSLVGDTGLIDMPSGKRYVITAMVKRPHNDDRAQELIRQIAATVYDYLSQPNPGLSAAPAPALDSATPAAAPIADPAASDPAATPASNGTVTNESSPTPDGESVTPNPAAQ